MEHYYCQTQTTDQHANLSTKHGKNRPAICKNKGNEVKQTTFYSPFNPYIDHEDICTSVGQLLNFDCIYVLNNAAH